MYDVDHHKPHPEGLLRILKANPGRKIYYIGDTVDDARCARAAEVPFIGIAAPSNPRYIDLVFLFQEEGAYAIVDDINFCRGLRRMRTATIQRDTKETRIPAN